MGETVWKDVLEPLIGFDRILRQDPAGAYAQMDFDGRDWYRKSWQRLPRTPTAASPRSPVQCWAWSILASQQKYSHPRERDSKVACWLLPCGRGRRSSPAAGGVPVSVESENPELCTAPSGRVLLSGIEIITFVILLTVIFLLDDSYRDAGTSPAFGAALASAKLAERGSDRELPDNPATAGARSSRSWISRRRFRTIVRP